MKLFTSRKAYRIMIFNGINWIDGVKLSNLNTYDIKKLFKRRYPKFEIKVQYLGKEIK